jgi:hypothetical protein
MKKNAKIYSRQAYIKMKLQKRYGHCEQSFLITWQAVLLAARSCASICCG